MSRPDDGTDSCACYKTAGEWGAADSTGGAGGARGGRLIGPENEPAQIGNTVHNLYLAIRR